MNELTLNEQQAMTSVEIASLTGKQHKNVMRDIRSLLNKGVNELNFELVMYVDNKGQERPMYKLTPKGCLILASGYDPILREKIINRLEEWEEGKRQKFPIPKTLGEALQLAADQQKQLESLGPAKDYYDAVSNSYEMYNIKETSKLLSYEGMGSNKMYGYLRKKKILMKNNLPYAGYTDKYFIAREKLYKYDTGERLVKVTYVTPEGVHYIKKLLDKDGYKQKFKR